MEELRPCCIQCFTDMAIVEEIQRNGATDCCIYCRSEEVATISPLELTGLLELLLLCVEQSDNGTHLSVIMRELKIISSKVQNPEFLINTIMGQSYANKMFVLKDSIREFQNQWSSFKLHLIQENRFFPNSSLYGRIFVRQEQNEGSYPAEATAFINTVTSLCKKKLSGHRFYRARISDEPLTSENMGCPPKDLASAGRANPVGIPYLYLAEDQQTCFREVRPSNGATIYLSEVVAKEDLKLVDLTNPKEKIALLKFDEDEIELTLKCLNLLEEFSNELSSPILPEKSHLEYIPTQFICEYLRTVEGYDGIIFNSSYGSGKNVVLFSESKVEITEPTANVVSSVEVHIYN